MALKAVFIDKDGTLIPDIPYNVDPALITLSPGAGATLARLKRRGYLLIVVSNQSGVARGLFPESALDGVRQRIGDLLAEAGAALDGFSYCPHHPDGTVKRYARECGCRKPKAGMLTGAAKAFGIDLSRSWMIGDITADSEAGNRAGCRTILIEKPYDPIVEVNDRSRPDYIVRDWQAVGQIILAEDKP